MASESEYWQRIWRRRLTRRRVLQGAALGGAGLAAAAVIGCAEEEKPAATPAARTATPGAAASPGATPTAAAVAPKKGGTLIAWDNSDPASFDLTATWGYKTAIYSSMVYPRMMKFKAFQGIVPAAFESEPDLAKGVEVSADGLTYTFKLMPATWEDKAPTSGRKLVAEDTKLSWERFMTKHPNRGLFRDVDRVEAPAEDTVVFKMKAPLGPLVQHLAHPGMFYTWPRELQDGDKLKTEQVSAGPFILQEYKVGVGLIYKRNPKYYRGPDRPYVDAVEIKIITDPSTQVAAFRSKQVDTNLWIGITQFDEPSLRKDLPKATFTEYSQVHDSMLTLDGNNPIFLDERVRQALSLMLDRDALLKVSGGKGFWCTSIGVLPRWWLDPKDKAKFGENVQYYHRDLAEAKKLLAAAGVETSAFKGLPFVAGPIAYLTRKSEYELGHAQLKEAGLDLELKVPELTAFYAIAVNKADHDGVAWAARQTSGDPNEMLGNVWQPGAPKAPSRGALQKVIEGDAKLQDLLTKQQRELNAEARTKILQEIQRYMSGKMYSIPLVDPSFWSVQQERVKDLFWTFSYGPGPEYLEKTWLGA